MAQRFAVDFAPSAARQLKKLDAAGFARVRGTIDLLEADPRPPGAKKLVGGDGAWRVRSGDYRVVYDIDNKRVRILVLAIGHRKDVYRAR